jgi:hypothetical protein
MKGFKVEPPAQPKGATLNHKVCGWWCGGGCGCFGCRCVGCIGGPIGWEAGESANPLSPSLTPPQHSSAFVLKDEGTLESSTLIHRAPNRGCHGAKGADGGSEGSIIYRVAYENIVSVEVGDEEIPGKLFGSVSQVSVNNHFHGVAGGNTNATRTC